MIRLKNWTPAIKKREASVFRHVDMVKMICWSSIRPSEWRRTEVWVTSQCVMFVGARWAEYFRNCWAAGIFTQSSLGFYGEKRKYPMSSSSLEENPVSMPEVRGEWSDWLEVIRQQLLKNSLVPAKGCRGLHLNAQQTTPWSRWVQQ